MDAELLEVAYRVVEIFSAGAPMAGGARQDAGDVRQRLFSGIAIGGAACGEGRAAHCRNAFIPRPHGIYFRR